MNEALKQSLDASFAIQELQHEVDRLLNENVRLMDEVGTLRILLDGANHALALYRELPRIEGRLH